MTLLRLACTIMLALICMPAGALAQTTAASVQAPAGYAPMQATCVKQTDGTCVPVAMTAPLPTAGKVESFSLSTANTASSAQTVYGGSYVFTQACTSYNSGTLALRYRAPDGATMTAMVSKTASDSTGGTLVSLGAGAVLDVSLPSGSTGCNAMLARVPS